MRLVWVPQWTVLPVIVEDQGMSDESSEQLGGRSSAMLDNPSVGSKSDFIKDVSSTGTTKEGIPYDFHVQEATPQQFVHGGQPFNLPGQSNPSSLPSREYSQGAFQMTSMATSLPSYQSRGQPQQPLQDQRYPGGYGSVGQYPQQHGHGIGPGGYPMQASPYGHTTQETAATFQMYGHMQASHRPYPGGPSPMQSGFPGGGFPQQLQQQYMYFPGQGNQMPMASPYHVGGTQYNAEVTRAFHNVYPGSSSQQSQFLRPSMPGGSSRQSSNSSSGSLPSTPRGPPRKPKQSGHALWVGNLPSGAGVGDLKDHFSREATKDIESVFLISKSSCAFVNYRSEAACAAAMQRFHDSRFQGVRLVCRLRRGPNASTVPATNPSPPVPGAPLGPSAQGPDVTTSQAAPEAIALNRQVSLRAAEEAKSGGGFAKALAKYFVMKSLTVEDMELSVQNKIWATQAHNEDALNKAYESAQNVFLIFSANKSGEYFGYARMASPINDEISASLDWAPRGETPAEDPDVPRSIPTPATKSAPRGRIIDDSARGTIFWEADLEEDDETTLLDGDIDHADGKPEETDEPSPSTAQSFGKPFRIEWVSTDRLPFYRTRGLRNPWNANREVKIARDGTELETSVGWKLTHMFNSPAPNDPRFAIPNSMPR